MARQNAGDGHNNLAYWGALAEVWSNALPLA
jgi:hypothetical protein